MQKPPSRFYEESSRARGDRAVNQPAIERSQQHRLLIVGTGMMGCEHMRVTTLLNRGRVHGIFDPAPASLDRAESYFRQLSPMPLVRYDTLEDGCADPEIDAVIITTPNYTHHQVAETVMRSGKPLLLEKPLATRVDQAAALTRAAAEYAAPFQVGLQYRYKAQYVDAFHVVRHDQALGDIKTISLAEYRPPFLDKVGQWNKFNQFSGGTLVEKCCHYFDLMNLLAESRPVQVYASGGQAVNFLDFEQDGNRADIDDHAFIIVDYANGVRGNFTLNMFCEELFEELVVTGERGRLVAREQASFASQNPARASLQVEVAGHPLYTGSDVGYPEVLENSGHHGSTYFEHEAFMDQLDGQPVDAATPLQALWALVVAGAAQESMSHRGALQREDYIAVHGLAALLGD